MLSNIVAMHTTRSQPGLLERVDVADVATRLHANAIRLLRQLRREDARTGLTPARLSALSVLVFSGARTLRELAEAEQVTAPTMSRIVAALLAEGMITRVVDVADRRAVRLEATAPGRRVMEEGRRRRVEILSAMLRSLSAEELGDLAKSVEILEPLLGRWPAPVLEKAVSSV
jgi:DNA-binding MarR family transcriptional regulator